jgi:7-cyano-7-deazaguanine synthase
MIKQALVLFSAGQDSTTCLAWALQQFSSVRTVGFDYGQRHAIELTQRPRVLAAFRAQFPAWAHRLGEDVVIDLKGFGAIAESALTAEREIAFRENGLPTTFVPGRNLAFLIAAAALGYRFAIFDLVGGMCETDYSGYPDCRRETLDATARALSLGMDADFTIHAPLMRLTKAQTWALAQDLGGPELVNLIRTETHTCYLGERRVLHDWGYGCGACPACELRAKGWAEFAGGRPAS